MILIAVFICFNTPVRVRAEETDDLLQFKELLYDYVDGLDLTGLGSSSEEYKRFFGEGDVGELVKKFIAGDTGVGFEDLFSYILRLVGSIAQERFYAIISVLFIAVFSAIVSVVRPDMDDGVNKLCDFLFSATVIGIVASIFATNYSKVKSVVGSFSAITQNAYPVIVALLTANGAGASVAVFSPAVTFLSGFYSGAIVNFLLPMCSVIFAFYSVGNLSDKIKLNKFGDFFKSVFKWTIGSLTLVFCFLMSAKTVVSSTFDGISFKALKYAFSNGVPIVSQMVQSGFDVVFASLTLVKNAVGIVTAVILLFAMLAPVIEIAVTSMILRFVSACIEPMGANFAQKCVTACADGFSLLSALLICSGICFMLTVFLLITALGGAV